MDQFISLVDNKIVDFCSEYNIDSKDKLTTLLNECIVHVAIGIDNEESNKAAKLVKKKKIKSKKIKKPKKPKKEKEKRIKCGGKTKTGNVCKKYSSIKGKYCKIHTIIKKFKYKRFTTSSVGSINYLDGEYSQMTPNEDDDEEDRGHIVTINYDKDENGNYLYDSDYVSLSGDLKDFVKHLSYLKKIKHLKNDIVFADTLLCSAAGANNKENITNSNKERIMKYNVSSFIEFIEIIGFRLYINKSILDIIKKL